MQFGAHFRVLRSLYILHPPNHCVPMIPAYTRLPMSASALTACLCMQIHDQLDDIRKKRFVELLQQAQAQGAAPKPAPSSASGAASVSSLV